MMIIYMIVLFTVFPMSSLNLYMSSKLVKPVPNNSRILFCQQECIYVPMNSMFALIFINQWKADYDEEDSEYHTPGVYSLQ